MSLLAGRPAIEERQEVERPRRGRPPARNEILKAGRLAGLDPNDLATRFGTSLFVYDVDVIERQVEALRAALPPAVELAYAVKANPALAIVAHLIGLGLGADVASAGELEAVFRAGGDPRAIVMTGPGKRDDEIRAAVQSGIRALTVESRDELSRVERISAEEGRVAPVLLRAAVPVARQLERVRLVGDDGAGKFGMDEEDLISAAHDAALSPFVDLLGLHAFGASNVTDAARLADHIAWTVDRARELATKAGFRLRLIDAGGGLGVPYETDDRALDLGALGRSISAIVERLASDPVTRDARLLLEPGRFLVASAGAYLTRVLGRKTVDGQHVVVIDGGVHQLLRPVLVGQEHRLRVLGERAGWTAKVYPVTVAGVLCSGLDVLASHAVMPLPEPGDLVAVLDVGAYGFTESMPFFLSHPIPAEVAVWRGTASLIRPRIEPSEWLDRQRLIGNGCARDGIGG